MRSANAASTSSKLPPDLERDYREFESALAAGVGGAGAGGARDEWGATGALNTSESLGLLQRYGRLVHDSSASLALISDGDRSTVYTRHVLDSLNPITLFDAPPASALDIGSGAGFPGIPLAIAWPKTAVVLLESRAKKAGFLERAARELGLKNVRVVCARLEDEAMDWRVTGPADTVFVRAVGDLPHILGHARARVRAGATWAYFLGAGSDGAPTLAALAVAGFEARVAPGLFGGRLLTGRFPAS